MCASVITFAYSKEMDGYVARMGEERGAYRDAMKKPEEKETLVRPSCTR